MAIFYLVRHGEAYYSEMLEKGFYGFGFSFAPLSQKGISQVETTALDERLKSALCVDVDLHEWMPDKSNQFTTSEEAFELTQEFNLHKGVYPERQSFH